jgi:hypothetical protein
MGPERAPGTTVPRWCVHAPDHRPSQTGTEAPLPCREPRAYGSCAPSRGDPGAPWGVGHGRRHGRPAAGIAARRDYGGSRATVTNRVTMRIGQQARDSRRQE